MTQCMKIPKLTLATLITILGSASAMAADPATIAAQDKARGTAYDDVFKMADFESHPDSYLGNDATSPGSTVASEFPGLRNLHGVISGVLYRSGSSGHSHAGFQGKMGLISASGIQRLCEAGFSNVIYDYPDPAVSATVSCQYKGAAQTLTYRSLDPVSPAARVTALKTIYSVIMNPAQGPVLTHCWNGDHASGEASAFALTQFCSKNFPAAGNNKAARSYWDKYAGELGQSQPKSAGSRVGVYTVSSAMAVPSAIQEAICPQP